MYLSSSTSKLAAYLGTAFTTTAPAFVVTYRNTNPASPGGATSNGSVSSSSSVSPTTILAGTGGGVEQVDYLNISNVDTVAATVTVTLTIGSTTVTMVSVALSAGDTLQYAFGKGWQVLDSSGRTRTIASTIASPITSSSANAFAVGPNGATNPSFNVDGSTSSAVTGLNIKSAASGAGLAVSVISSAGAEALTIDAKSTGTIGIGTVSTGAITLGAATTISGNLTLSTHNLVTDTSTGSQIATATSQKLGFWGATPVAQPAANSDTTTGAAGGTTTVYLNTTYAGPSGASAYTIGGIVKALKAVGILAA